MKKIFALLITICMIAILQTSVFASDLEYTALYVGSNKAFVNDAEQQIDTDNPNVKVFVENNRSYVPVRFISENYDGQVEWVQETQTVNISFKEVFYSKGLILISDIPDILHETWDADIVDMLIEYYFK